MEKVPLTNNLIGLLFVSCAELSFDQRMSLTSIMAHRGIDLAGLDAGTLRDIFIEIFCNPRTAVDNPLRNNAGHGGRGSFIVLSNWGGSFWHHDLSDPNTHEVLGRRIARFLGLAEVACDRPRVFIRLVNHTGELCPLVAVVQL